MFLKTAIDNQLSSIKPSKHQLKFVINICREVGSGTVVALLLAVIMDDYPGNRLFYGIIIIAFLWYIGIVLTNNIHNEQSSH